MAGGHQIVNSRLLRNLNASINENHISGTICQLRKEVYKIESVSGRSLRTIKLRNEIATLEEKLSYSKIQSNLRMQQFYKTKPED